MATERREQAFVEGCAEHGIPLIDGCCPECKDANGNTFVLDMQSKVLLKPEKDVTDTISCLECVECGERLNVSRSLRVEELKNALGAFMTEHIILHGSADPTFQFFIPDTLDGDLYAMPKYDANMVTAGGKKS